MSRTVPKPTSPPVRQTTPATRLAFHRLLPAILLVVCGLAFLTYRAYQTLVLSRPPARLRLGENVPLTAPPPMPTDDSAALHERLQPLEQMRASVRAHPEDVGAQVDFARKAAAVGDILSSDEAWRAALRHSPQADPVAEEALGRCQLQLGLYTDALHTYQRLLERAPQEAAPYIGLSRAQSALGRNDAAMQTLERAARALSASDARGHLGIAAEFEQHGDLPRALAETQAAHASAPDNPDIAVSLAHLLYDLQRLPEAQRLLEPLVAAHPDNNRARRLLAAILNSPLNPHRDPAQAENQLLQALEQNARDPDALQRLGELYQEQGRYRQAAYIYTTLLQVTPDSAAGRLQLASTYARLGDARTGAQQREIARNLIARDREEERLITLRNQRPTDPRTHLTLARHYLRAGQLFKAFTELQSAYALSRGGPEARAELTALYARIGLPAPALPGEKP